MKSIAVLGYSNTGKTTFIEHLTNAAAAAGIRTAILKFSRHPGDFDRPGSDTDRFLRTPAQFVGYRNDERWVLSVPAPPPEGHDTPPIEVLPPWMEPLLRSVDLLVLEGRRPADSYVVPCTGNAAVPEDDKYPPETADLVITDDPAPAAARLISIFTHGGIQ